MASGNTSLTAGLARLRENAKRVNPDYEHDLDRLIVEEAVAGAAYMKEHAPWRDDTGNRKDRVPGEARASLNTTTDLDGDLKEITFSHGVYYGIWLETKYSGKDEIILPSVKHIGAQLMSATEGSLNIGLRRGPGSTKVAAQTYAAAAADDALGDL